MIHYFDRSRIETEHKCPRRQYWEYYYDGKGLAPAKLNPHLAFGSAVHEALACILSGCKELDVLPNMQYIQGAIGHAATCLRATFTQSKGFQAEVILEEGFDGQMIQVTEDQTWLLDHYCDLLEGLVIGWCLVRLPELLQQYRILEVETEEWLTFETKSFINHKDYKQPFLADIDLVFLSRPDAIMERRTDGALVIMSFKTTSQANTLWLENFKTDQQTISEVLPVESRLGREVAGVQVEGLVKGQARTEWPKGSKHYHHSSPLVWGYLKEEGGFQNEWTPKFEYTDEAGNNRRLGKGWNRQRVATTYPGGIAEWVGYLYQNEPELLRAQFISPPLVTRSAQELEEWQEQVKYREVEVANALVQINAWQSKFDDIERVSNNQLLSCIWPKHTTGCAYDPQFHSKCPCYTLCWGSEGNDPMGCGSFVYRTPNHPTEEL